MHTLTKEGVISTPVAGSIGTYVFKVTGRDIGAFYTETFEHHDSLHFLGKL